MYVDLNLLKQRIEECEIPNVGENVDVNATQISDALYIWVCEKSKVYTRAYQSSEWEWDAE